MKTKFFNRLKSGFYLPAVMILLLANACNDDLFVKGNGIPADEARLVSPFSSVASDGDFEVYIQAGEDTEVLINAESNLLPYITTRVNDGKLKIQVSGVPNLRNRLPVKVFIVTPHLTSISLNGSGSIIADSITGEHVFCAISGSGSVETMVNAGAIDAVISGSGKLMVWGVAEDAKMTISGSGKIDAWDLEVKNCDAKISGSGNLWISVEQYLNSVISGSGNVYYRGSPVLETVVSGSGGVIHKN